MLAEFCENCEKLKEKEGEKEMRMEKKDEYMNVVKLNARFCGPCMLSEYEYIAEFVPDEVEGPLLRKVSIEVQLESMGHAYITEQSREIVHALY